MLLSVAGRKKAPNPGQGRAPERPFYSDHLLSALQSALACLADVDVRYEIERDYLEEWSGPDEVKQRLIAMLEAGRRRDREPIVQRLTWLEEQIGKPRPAPRPESMRHEGEVGSNKNELGRRSAA